jgi:hypothetical protein
MTLKPRNAVGQCAPEGLSSGLARRNDLPVSKIPHVEGSEVRPPQPPSRRLHRKLAAAHLGVSLSWLDKSRLRGDGPVFLQIGGRIVYYTADLDDYMERCRRHSTSSVKLKGWAMLAIRRLSRSTTSPRHIHEQACKAALREQVPFHQSHRRPVQRQSANSSALHRHSSLSFSSLLTVRSSLLMDGVLVLDDL